MYIMPGVTTVFPVAVDGLSYVLNPLLYWRVVVELGYIEWYPRYEMAGPFMLQPHPVEVAGEVAAIVNLNQYDFPLVTGKLRPVTPDNVAAVVDTSPASAVKLTLDDAGIPAALGTIFREPSGARTLNPSPC